MKIAEGTLHKKSAIRRFFFFIQYALPINEIFERIKIIKLSLNIFSDQAIFLQTMMTRN